MSSYSAADFKRDMAQMKGAINQLPKQFPQAVDKQIQKRSGKNAATFFRETNQTNKDSKRITKVLRGQASSGDELMRQFNRHVQQRQLAQAIKKEVLPVERKFNNELKRRDSQLKRIDKGVKDATKKVGSFQRAINKIERTSESLAKGIAKVNNAIAKVEGRVVQFGQRLTKIGSDALQAIGISKNLQSQVGKLGSKVGTAVNKLAALSTLVDTVIRTMEIKSIYNQINKLTMDVVRLGNDVSKALGFLKGTRDRLERVEKFVYSLQDRVRDLNLLRPILDDLRASTNSISGALTGVRKAADQGIMNSQRALNDSAQALNRILIISQGLNAVTTGLSAANTKITQIGNQALQAQQSAQKANTAATAADTAAKTATGRVGALEGVVNGLRSQVSSLQSSTQTQLSNLGARVNQIPAIQGAVARAEGLAQSAQSKAATALSTAQSALNRAMTPGPQGPRGLPGINGLNGRNGTDGRNGIDGKNGKDGKDGRNGIDGKDGINGRDGKDMAADPEIKALLRRIDGTTTATKAETSVIATQVPLAKAAAQNASTQATTAATQAGAAREAIGTVGNRLMEYYTRFEKFATWMKVPQALNVLNTWLLIHNAMMLSRNIVSTLGEVMSQGLTLAGIKDEDENPIDVNGLIGAGFNEIKQRALGVENAKRFDHAWNSANKIYQSATNIVNNIINIQASIFNVLEVLGNNIHKIGNALRAWGEVGERAYEWMNPSMNFDNRYTRFLQGVDDAAANLSSITSDLVGVQESAGELARQKIEIENQIRQAQVDFNRTLESQPVRDKMNADKAASESPPIIITDLIMQGREPGGSGG